LIDGLVLMKEVDVGWIGMENGVWRRNKLAY